MQHQRDTTAALKMVQTVLVLGQTKQVLNLRTQTVGSTIRWEQVIARRPAYGFAKTT